MASANATEYSWYVGDMYNFIAKSGDNVVYDAADVLSYHVW
jgi:hypothetical protein